MEHNRSEDGVESQLLDPEFVAWAKQRMGEMDREAEEVTAELGLPRELKYTLLDALHGTLTVRAPDAATGDSPTDNKLLLYDEILEGFLSESVDLKRHVARFRTLWSSFEKVPMQALATNSPGLQRSVSALGFAGGSSQLIPLISLVSWAILSWPVEETACVREARSRGLSPTVGTSVARYLRARLPT